MIAWRTDLTALTDLSAGMFAACFTMLLIFLSLIENNPRDAGLPEDVAIEVTEAVRGVRQTVMSPREMVEMLQDHRAGSPSQLTIDIFSDRIALRLAGEHTDVVGGLNIGAAVAQAWQQADDRPAALFVFSHELYDEVVAPLSASGAPWREMSVPLALREPDRPQEGWRQTFLDLSAVAADPALFRERLAAILDGGTGGEDDASAGGKSGGGTAVFRSLLDRLENWLSTAAAITFPLVILSVMFGIERSRFRPDPRLAAGQKLDNPQSRK